MNDLPLSDNCFKVVQWWKLHLSYQSQVNTKTSSLYEKKNADYYFQISLFIPEIFKFFKYANYPLTSYSQPNFDQINYDEKRCLSQFASEMFDSLQWDSTKGAPQNGINSCVTMATYLIPDNGHLHDNFRQRPSSL